MQFHRSNEICQRYGFISTQLGPKERKKKQESNLNGSTFFKLFSFHWLVIISIRITLSFSQVTLWVPKTIVKFIELWTFPVRIFSFNRKLNEMLRNALENSPFYWLRNSKEKNFLKIIIIIIVIKTFLHCRVSRSSTVRLTDRMKTEINLSCMYSQLWKTQKT